ncbi:hypothetical protein I8748_27575 [Nostoc sp. CENA67]|uniref:Pentapeptide repeat-containing protein n=1 Tax=Amazonocrinis nigriterrae CENA67 TaxID=2794033 RepID=A0A8J7HUN3_9NOST|nr:hypothetical protein [Amazonocrinis nigriterrae CENA67]
MDLVDTDVIHANFKDTQLMDCDFSSFRVKGACFTDAQGLTCQHKQWLRVYEALNIPA